MFCVFASVRLEELMRDVNICHALGNRSINHNYHAEIRVS